MTVVYESCGLYGPRLQHVVSALCADLQYPRSSDLDYGVGFEPWTVFYCLHHFMYCRSLDQYKSVFVQCPNACAILDAPREDSSRTGLHIPNNISSPESMQLG
jgi:hypothetical protein